MKLALSRKNLWEKTPLFLKSAVGGMLRAIPPEIFLGRKFKINLKLIQEADWWSRQQAREYQFAELRRICSLAFNHTTYYKRIFLEAEFNPEKMSSSEDLRKLPVINRDVVNTNLMEMVTTPVSSSHVDYITTGGTSGVPLRFYIGANRSAIEYPYLLKSWERIGYKLGMPLAVFRGRIVKKNNNGLYHEHDPILNHHYYSNFHMDDINMELYINHIRTIGSCFLHVYPSSVANLARYIKRSSIKPPGNILGILAESENVYPNQRKMVEEVFQVPYFSSYGHTEKLVAAAECQHSSNYHVWPSYGYFELLDNQDKPVTTPGERGEIVGTGFINKVVPFIRYRTGDFATYIGERCVHCGREHTIISDISGHNVQENLIARDGSYIPWSAVNMHDDTFDNVLQYQMFQDTPGRGILKVVPATTFSESDEKLILRNFGRKFEDRFVFEVLKVDEILLSKRGKAIFVDQRIPFLDELQVC